MGWLFSFRARLLMLVLLALVPLLGLTAYSAYEQRRAAVAGAEAEAVRIVERIDRAQRRVIDASHALLFGLARAPAVRRLEPGACSALLAAARRQFPTHENIAVAGLDGVLRCNAVATSRAVSFADREWFQRAMSMQAFVADRYIVGRVTLKPILVLALPILDDAGRVRAVASAGLGTTWLGHLVAETRLPPGTDVLLIDGEGMVLARFPQDGSWVGRHVEATDLFRSIRGPREARTAHVPGLDGVPRLYAFKPLESVQGETYAAVGIPESAVFAEANRLLLVNLVGLALVLAITLAAALVSGRVFVLRPIDALVSATRRLQAGERDTRVELPDVRGELGELVRGFNELAVALEERAGALERARADLEQRAERLRALREIDQAILRAGSPEEIARTVLQHLRRLVAAPRAAVALYDLGAGEAEWLAVHTDGPTALGPGVRFPLEMAGDLAALGRGEVQVIDVTRLAHLPPARALAAEGIRAYVVIPLRADGELIGSLNFGWADARPLDGAHFEIAREVASPLAVAIQQTRFRERIERHALELEQRVAERTREVQEASRAKSEFLSRMSHELRTPLNAVLGFAQLLAPSPLGEEDRESVTQILRAGRHLLGMINEILDLARIEARRMTLSPEPIEVGEAIRAALSLVQSLAAQRRIELGAELRDAGERHVLADRQRLQQVLLNLLSNAIKYNRDGGRVTVTAGATTGARVRIVVEDTGPGIAPARLERLFVPFERLGAEASGVEGTGLGLTLSRGLVGAMGGTLGVESREGEGATFWLELAETPRPADAGVPEGAPGTAPSDAWRGKVLYIEDNLSNLKLVERIVARRPGVELLSAMQGRRGLDLAREHRPLLILLDIHLPDLPGREVLARLRADPGTRDIPVVILSADATPGQIKRLLTEGARAYLTKPVDVGQLLAMLDEQLAADAQNGTDT